MRTYVQFLRQHPLWWLVPILAYLGGLLWLASAVVGTPENPFMYSAY